MKQIAFTIIDNGIDGREPARIVYAAWNDAARDAALARNPNKAYLRPDEQIVDVDKAKAAALAKLNGLDRLLLGLAEEEK